jgi:hypothetical protein
MDLDIASRPLSFERRAQPSILQPKGTARAVLDELVLINDLGHLPTFLLLLRGCFLQLHDYAMNLGEAVRVSRTESDASDKIGIHVFERLWTIR